VRSPVGDALVPGDAPEPVAIFQDLLQGGPGVAVGREDDARLAALELFGAKIDRPAEYDHEAIVGGYREFGVAQVDVFFGDERGGLPFIAVGGGDDADFAIAADVAIGLAEDAPPAVVPADQIGEGIVGGRIP